MYPPAKAPPISGWGSFYIQGHGSKNIDLFGHL